MMDAAKQNKEKRKDLEDYFKNMNMEDGNENESDNDRDLMCPL